VQLGGAGNPKPEGNPKSEIRRAYGRLDLFGFRISGFGFLSGFGFRISVSEFAGKINELTNIRGIRSGYS